jgi:hypothetical protein
MSDRYDALIEAIGGLADRPRESTLFLAYEDSEVAAIADASEDELTYAVECAWPPSRWRRRWAVLQALRISFVPWSGSPRPGRPPNERRPENSAATPASRPRAGPSPRPRRVR